MSDTRPPETPPAIGSTSEDRARILAEHFLRHGRTHTLEALGRAALGAGYSQEDVTAAVARFEARSASAEASAPGRSTARRAILASYGLTYLAFAFVFLTQPFGTGVGPIALIILTGALGLALGLSAMWAGRSTWSDRGAGLKVASILSVPIVLLVLVAGTCAVTTFPSISR